jgi:hypothetical protein
MHRLLSKFKSRTSEPRRAEDPSPRDGASTRHSASGHAPRPPARRCLNEAAHKLAK